MIHQTPPYDDTPTYRRRVVIKFHDDVPIPYEAGAERFVEEYGLGSWQELADAFPGITIRPKFTAVSPATLRDLVEKATATDETYRPPNFFSYFVVELPEKAPDEEVADFLRSWEGVDFTYAESDPAAGPAVIPDDPKIGRQGYLEAHNPAAAAHGIDARFAWGVPGGDGAGIRLVDVEQGWYLDHEDLPPLPLLAGIDIGDVPDTAVGPVANPANFKKQQRAHGSNVLGIILGADNTAGGLGIAPGAAGAAASVWWKREEPPESGQFAYALNIADAILGVLPALAAGDVLLLQVQLRCAADCAAEQHEPVELEPAIYEAIRLATALDIVVVEAAGNGTKTNDKAPHAAGAFDLALRPQRGTGLHALDPDNEDEFRDSGAILVGAATKAFPHARLTPASPACTPIGDPSLSSNYGRRVNCYAWGQCVYTPGVPDGSPTNYNSQFNSTSSAAAIVAGAALAVQGTLRQRAGRRLDSWEMRTLLANEAYGTPSADPDVDQIGVMPNLFKLLNQGLDELPPA